jgi:hypothetical protein
MSSEHTKEPWRVEPDEGSDGEIFWIATDAETEIALVPDGRCADARRIVACVNALSGMPIEKIDGMADMRQQGTPFVIYRAADMAQVDGTLANVDFTVKQLRAALQIAEEFMSGFEDDVAQEGMAEKLATIRAAMVEAAS